jgi:hypothetical protein
MEHHLSCGEPEAASSTRSGLRGLPTGVDTAGATSLNRSAAETYFTALVFQREEPRRSGAFLPRALLGLRSTDRLSRDWPVHEVGRNPDYFDPRGARLLRAGSNITITTLHLHSNGADTKAHLEIGFKLLPKGYEPEYKRSRINLGNGMDMDIQPNENNQLLHASDWVPAVQRRAKAWIQTCAAQNDKYWKSEPVRVRGAQ